MPDLHPEYDRGWKARGYYVRDRRDLSRAQSDAASSVLMAWTMLVFFGLWMAGALAGLLRGHWEPWVFLVALGGLTVDGYIFRSIPKAKRHAAAMERQFKERWNV